MAEETGLSTLGLISDDDYAKFQAMQQYSEPIVSPWLSLGVGALMGLYAQRRQKKQRKKDVELAAKTARLSPYTGLRAQNPGPAPDLVANLIGGVGGAMGVAKSVNAYSAAKNISDAIAARKARDALEDFPGVTPLSPDYEQQKQWQAEAAMPYAYREGGFMDGPQLQPPANQSWPGTHPGSPEIGYTPYSQAAPGPRWAPQGVKF